MTYSDQCWRAAVILFIVAAGIIALLAIGREYKEWKEPAIRYLNEADRNGEWEVYP